MPRLCKHFNAYTDKDLSSGMFVAICPTCGGMSAYADTRELALLKLQAVQEKMVVKENPLLGKISWFPKEPKETLGYTIPLRLHTVFFDVSEKLGFGMAKSRVLRALAECGVDKIVEFIERECPQIDYLKSLPPFTQRRKDTLIYPEKNNEDVSDDCS